MPFYEYECEGCKKQFVLLQSMNAKAEDTVCPYCSASKARKLLSKFSSSSSAVCSTGGQSWGGGGG